jgi:hypothetical protein
MAMYESGKALRDVLQWPAERRFQLHVESQVLEGMHGIRLSIVGTGANRAPTPIGNPDRDADNPETPPSRLLTPRGTSCTSCRCRTDRGRCARG